MLSLSDPKIIFTICAVVLVLAGYLTFRWLHHRRFVRTLAICLGILLLVITTSRDRKTSQTIQAEIDIFHSKVETAEVVESQQASRIENLESENKELTMLLSKSSAEKQESAEKAMQLERAANAAASQVAQIVPGKANSITLRIKNFVLFDIDKADLRCDSRETLSKVIGFLTYQVQLPHTQIQIYGHTDNTGSDAHDDDLSNARAEQVKKYFSDSGIPPGVMSSHGMGKRQPVGYTEPQPADVIDRENRTSEQQQRNRRVEIVVSTQ